MLIASKTDEEMYAPEVRDFVYITDSETIHTVQWI